MTMVFNIPSTFKSHKMKKRHIILIVAVMFIVTACKFAQPERENKVTEKHNYIVLLDLSDRLIVQDNQPERDKEIIKYIYQLFEEKVRKDLYIRSRDEIKVVIAPQRGAGLSTNEYEDRLFINMENIKNIYRRPNEEQRRKDFYANLDSLYDEAVFSNVPDKYYGADIWKYFYEDLETDYVRDTLARNFLFILTDGYPVVGNDPKKLRPVKHDFSDLHIVLVEAAPRDKDLEWDHVMEIWTEWFDQMQIKDYTFIKRKAISKEKEEIQDIVSVEEDGE